jgi:predicted XRE-type DNA-binding protein
LPLGRRHAFFIGAQERRAFGTAAKRGTIAINFDHRKKHERFTMSANARNRKTTASRRKLPEHEIGSGNVFADIGMPDPELELAKASVAAAIVTRIRSLQLSQSEAAARMGIDQPRVSKINCGRLGEFALGSLFEFALRLGIDFNIEIGHEQNPTAAGRVSIHGDLVAV